MLYDKFKSGLEFNQILPMCRFQKWIQIQHLCDSMVDHVGILFFFSSLGSTLSREPNSLSRF